MINLMTLAGKGNRFSREGYNIPKPLIRVNENYMISEAIKCLPSAEKYVFVCLKEHAKQYKIDEILLTEYTNSEIIYLDEVTDGQACTAEYGILNSNTIDLSEPLLISSCDYGLEWDKDKYNSLDADVIVWSTIHNEAFSNNPSSYSWLDVDGDRLLKTYVKQKVFENSYNNHAIVGTFYFKKAKYFIDGVKKIYEKDIRSNNEFYIDNIFNVLPDLDIKIFDVDEYYCWGTPEDLKNYEN
jgi:NDP-sugar pyrophosphorylase family protein